MTQRTGIIASKIAHQLDHSMSLVNEIILRQRRMNGRLEHLGLIEKISSPIPRIKIGDSRRLSSTKVLGFFYF
uniref:Uncharacterized protein n=1 Tax=Romanomermis culicivorax TaxID=13658 RepID=A0A915JV15_ROMCU